jgi:hypothetical protein
VPPAPGATTIPTAHGQSMSMTPTALAGSAYTSLDAGWRLRGGNRPAAPRREQFLLRAAAALPPRQAPGGPQQRHPPAIPERRRAGRV